MNKQKNKSIDSLGTETGKSVEEEVFLSTVWAELVQLEPSIDYSTLVLASESLSPTYITHPHSRQYLIEKVLSSHYKEEFEFPFDAPPQKYISVMRQLLELPTITLPTLVAPILVESVPSNPPLVAQKVQASPLPSFYGLQKEAANAQTLAINCPARQVLPDKWWWREPRTIPIHHVFLAIESENGQKLEKGIDLSFQVETEYEHRSGKRGKVLFSLTPEQEVSGLGTKDRDGRRDRQRGGLVSMAKNRSEFATGYSSQQPRRQVTGSGICAIICAGPVGVGQHRDTKKVFFGYNLINWLRPPPPLDGWNLSDVAVLAQSEFSSEGCYFRLIDHVCPLPTDPRTMRHLARFVTSTMFRNIGKVVGAPGFGYLRFNVDSADLMMRIERIAKLPGPMLFADCEGSKDRQQWGLCSLKLNSGVTSFTITTAPDPSAFANQLVLSKDPSRERSLTDPSLGIEYINIDDLIPWKEERPHSPIGGVLQMCVRLYALLHSVPHLDYDDSNIRHLYELSRSGVVRTISGQIGMTDAISVLIMSVGS